MSYLVILCSIAFIIGVRCSSVSVVGSAPV